jgi:hypothetical protein
LEPLKKNIPLNSLILVPTFCNSQEKRSSNNKSCYRFQEAQLLIVETWDIAHFLFQRLGTWSVQWNGLSFHSIGFKNEQLLHQFTLWYSKAMYNCIHIEHGIIEIQKLTYGYQYCLLFDVFQKFVSKLVRDMEYDKTNFYDLWILTNSIFKYYLFNLEMVLARLSTSESLVWEWIASNLTSLQKN